MLYSRSLLVIYFILILIAGNDPGSNHSHNQALTKIPVSRPANCFSLTSRTCLQPASKNRF